MEFTADLPFTPPSSAVAERIRTQPEYHLLWAVLREGIETYMKYTTVTNRRGQRLFKEAEKWILDDDPTWLCSFISICHVLGLEPEYLRTGLQRWRAGQRSEHLEHAA
jgi:hypothetical protein